MRVTYDSHPLSWKAKEDEEELTQHNCLTLTTLKEKEAITDVVIVGRCYSAHNDMLPAYCAVTKIHHLSQLT